MAKDCGNHGEHKRHKLYRRLFAAFLLLVVAVLLLVLIVWLLLRPTKPKFYLQDASLLQFNVTPGAAASASASAPLLLTTVLQITLSPRNPNDRIGVCYDRLDAFILYKAQQITAATALPVGYQGHNDVTVWSPYLYGSVVPLTPFHSVSLSMDQNAGYLLLHARLDGHIRWKVGSWISPHYHLQVDCPFILTVGPASSTFRFQRITSCTVDV